ncbi:MAG: GAP family protein, partial [Bacillota bacterium]
METLLAIGGLALLDSINPSALLATLYLLKRSRPAAAVTTYMAGVFVTYFTVAVLLMLGL